MVVTLRVLHYIFEHLDAYFLFVVTLPLLLLGLLSKIVVLLFGPSALEPHPAGVAELIVQGHLRHLVGALAPLATLGSLPLDLLVVRLLPLDLLRSRLVIREKAIVINLVQFHFRQIFLQISRLQSPGGLREIRLTLLLLLLRLLYLVKLILEVLGRCLLARGVKRPLVILIDR